MTLASGSRGLNSKCVDTLLQFFGERCVDHAVLLHARLPPEGHCHDSDTEMAFTVGPRTGMAVMQA